MEQMKWRVKQLHGSLIREEVVARAPQRVQSEERMAERSANTWQRHGPRELLLSVPKETRVTRVNDTVRHVQQEALRVRSIMHESNQVVKNGEMITREAKENARKRRKPGDSVNHNGHSVHR